MRRSRSRLRQLVAMLFVSGSCGPTLGGAATEGATTGEVASSSTSTSTTSGGDTRPDPPPTSSSTTDISSTTSDSTTGPPVVEVWDGLIHYDPDAFNPYSTFVPCGTNDYFCVSGNVDDYPLCNGSYVRLRGYADPEDTHGFLDSPCSGLLVIEEVLEARYCEPSDCGGEPACTAPICHGQHGCDPVAQDCPDGMKCQPLVKSELQGDRWEVCVDLPDDPLSVGQACTVDDDACDAGLRCWSPDVLSNEGTCVEICGLANPTCTDTCAPCLHETHGLCVCEGCSAEAFC